VGQVLAMPRSAMYVIEVVVADGECAQIVFDPLQLVVGATNTCGKVKALHIVRKHAGRVFQKQHIFAKSLCKVQNAAVYGFVKLDGRCTLGAVHIPHLRPIQQRPVKVAVCPRRVAQSKLPIMIEVKDICQHNPTPFRDE